MQQRAPPHRRVHGGSCVRSVVVRMNDGKLARRIYIDEADHVIT